MYQYYKSRKNPYQYYRSRENLYQVLQVKCTALNVHEIEASYDKIVISIVAIPCHSLVAVGIVTCAAHS